MRGSLFASKLAFLLGAATAIPSVFSLPSRYERTIDLSIGTLANKSDGYGGGGGGGGGFWLENIKHQGAAAFNSDPAGYPVFRNVKEFGAKGDGTTDDTDAINAAIQAGGRCGLGCDSSTITPGLIYFPAGTYLVSKPIVAMYYSQLVGDATDLPVIKAAASFKGIGVIDSDPYTETGQNWYTNQNNFFRQVRNFVIDLRGMSTNAGTGIHWQVAQASSLMNIRFEMHVGGNTTQQGIFMDNGSGGHMSDLTFNGGKYGAFFGNQQFMTRNLKFNNCQTAIFMNWNWQWTLKSVEINNCKVGLDMTSGGAETQNVGSVVLMDSSISNTATGVLTHKSASSLPKTAGTLLLDNVQLRNVGKAVANPAGATLLAGGSKNIDLWGQGNKYSASDVGSAASSNASSFAVQGALTRSFSKPLTLLDSDTGRFFEKSRPQYENVPASSFISVKSSGAKGDGKTDDTDALNAIFAKHAGSDNIIFFDHGVYVVSSTVEIPVNTRIVGEVWSVILASGEAFQDPNSPTPVFQVGKPGDCGVAEISELIFETKGPQAGAVLVEWNSRDPADNQGANGLWDVHFRIAGSAGTDLSTSQCAKAPNSTITPDPACLASFAHLHIGKTASLYLENIWAWTADHALDGPDFGQITVYNGRGIYSESTEGPVWYYATAAEHNQLYQYQIQSSKNVFMAMIQTETPYYQSNPSATVPFAVNTDWNDPDFSKCNGDASCAKAWALRIVDSSNIMVYGAGLYSFFENYAQDCIKTQSCQKSILSIEGSCTSVALWNLNTIASKSMVDVNGKGIVAQGGNENSFTRTLVEFLN